MPTGKPNTSRAASRAATARCKLRPMFGAADLHHAMSHCSLGQGPPGKRMCIAQEAVPRDDVANWHGSRPYLGSMSADTSQEYEADMDMEEVDSIMSQQRPLFPTRRASPCLEHDYQSYAMPARTSLLTARHGQH